MFYADAKEFVDYAGIFNFGKITKDISDALGIPEGAIRLQRGVPGASGFGNRHVEAYENRMKQLRGRGYTSFSAFSYAVSSGYQKICQGDANRFILVRDEDGYDHCIVIEYDTDSGFWLIITGLPKRVERSPVLHTVSRTGGSEPTPSAVGSGRRSRFETLRLPSKPKKGTDGSRS